MDKATRSWPAPSEDSRKHIIAMCREMLELAEEGELDALAVVGVVSTGEQYIRWILPERVPAAPFIAGLPTLQHAVMTTIYGPHGETEI